ncbi:hypothetical protein SAMN05216410_1447 [Sanguibacter gelidistatuariae]|uniref:DUF4386 family protein n=1 Tax=Sanguibacter gelidistatuariae TaxID=1814289 RepID=A0A1G6JY47_9MICO|nr:hypothetical protein [Sanguibacter gelidistatuariae]SDC23709.1 hypothetical protein SAMN05216410_1447 [Sanguibacter gelidistatuariae]
MTSDLPRAVPVPGEGHRLQGSGAGAAGLAFAVLFSAGFLLLDRRPPDGTDAAVLAFYRGTDGWMLLVAGCYLVPFAGVCFLWFIAATRHRMGLLARREDTLLGTVQLACGVLFVAMMYAAAAASVTGVAGVRLGDVDDTSDLAQLRTMTTFGEAILMIFAIRTAAVFMIVSTTRAWRAHLFPRWFAVLSYLGAFGLMLTLTYARAVVLVIPLWVATASAIILFRRARGELAVA